MNLIIQTNQKIEKGLRDSYLSMQSFLPDVDWNEVEEEQIGKRDNRQESHSLHHFLAHFSRIVCDHYVGEK